jgi:aminoglycoside phosphotransferase (APT) family kinase protein
MNPERQCPELAQNAVDIVHEVTGIAVERVDPIMQGRMTHKFCVQTVDDASFIVRFYPPARDFVLKYEPDLLRRCADVGVPVPRVVVDSRTGPLAERSYVMYQKIKGRTLADRLPALTMDQRRIIGAELVTSLSQLRRIGFSGYGELVSSEQGRSASWRSFIYESFTQGLTSIEQHHLLDTGTIRAMKSICDRLDEFSSDEMSEFIWGDINFENILVDEENHLAGIIDFEGSLSGDSLATLGYGFAVYGDHAFLGTMINAWPEPLLPNRRNQLLFYALLRTVRLGKFAHQPLPTGLRREPLDQIFPGMRLALLELHGDFSKDTDASIET